MEEREELEIERKVWSKCSQCEEEYAKGEGGNIVMNMNCFHSYCKECIEQSASTSLLCPVCHSSLPTPLSSLPINFTLCYWQSLSPPLPLLLNNINNMNSINNNNNNNKEYQHKCEDCEEEKGEVNYCSDCTSILCTSCSNEIHSRKSMKNHSISSVSSFHSSTVASPEASPIIKLDQCEIHNKNNKNNKQRAKELYCMTCNESVCVDCIGEFHSNHVTKTIIKRVEDIKGEWKNSVEKISTYQLNEVDIHCEKASKYINKMNKEIKKLEELLKSLIDKKERMMEHMQRLKESKEKINQTTSFLLSFLQSLPPLPLSSFIPPSSSINNNDNNINNIKDNNINNDNKEEKGRGRIKNFFEKENLISLYSSLLPSSSKIFPKNDQESYIDKYSEEEKEKRNKMIFSNQLIRNQNLLSTFNSKFNSHASNPFSLFNTPDYITYNDKLNMMGVSYYIEDKVRIMDKNGALIRSFSIQKPRGIAIIPSLSLLAVSSGENHVIDFFDISSLLYLHNNNNNNNDHPSNNNNNNNLEEDLPLLYSIGKGIGGGDDHFHFNIPYGIGYSEGKGILAACNNQRIEIYKIRRDGYEHEGMIPNLQFNPIQIAISSPGDLILSLGDDPNSDVFSRKFYIKTFIHEEEEEDEEGEKKIRWREEGEIRSPPSLHPPLTTPKGIAIHSPLNYCVICDMYNNRILFFNITTRDLICSYQPTLPPPLPLSSATFSFSSSPDSNYYFKYACGISIDEEADLISVSDGTSHSISIFHAPIFKF